jgi:hypothetical protein
VGGVRVSDVARAVAFYLPQFHPIPENDAWWGAGFTEWTNVARARRLYPGHRQPDLPADLGFYDLRLPEAREAQAVLAQQYGVEAFAYWHSWANQTWSGIWHGDADRVLVQQHYPGVEDYRAHFDAVLPAFRDERYLRVGGRPVFYVFRPEELPDAAVFVDLWQGWAREAGLEGLYLVAEMSDLLGRGVRYDGVEEDGFDAGVYMRMPAETSPSAMYRMRAYRKLAGGPEVYPYSTDWTSQNLTGPHIQPCVYPNWDNTPRSGRGGVVLRGASPKAFGVNVREAVESLASRPADERLLWVKSWNEWAEGNHLEPDLRFGHAWLEALRDGLRG